MGSRRRENCRRGNELWVWRDARLPGRAFTIGQNKFLPLRRPRLSAARKRPMKFTRVIMPTGVTPKPMTGSGQGPPLAGGLPAPRLADAAIGELPHVAAATLRTVHKQGDGLDALQAGPMDMDVQAGIDRLAGLRAAEDERIHRAPGVHIGKIPLT
jgi:hypothetical protein